jgi:hypothetical protein
MLVIDYLECKATKLNIVQPETTLLPPVLTYGMLSMPPHHKVPSPPPFDNSGIPSSEPEDEGKAPPRGQRKPKTYQVSDFFDDECAVHNKKKTATKRRTLILSSNEDENLRSIPSTT